jgi:hypothetical protein
MTGSGPGAAPAAEGTRHSGTGAHRHPVPGT